MLIRQRLATVAAVLACAMASVTVPAGAALDLDPAQMIAHVNASFAKGAAAGWHLADQLEYFSTVLGAGRLYELRLHDDPNNRVLQNATLDLATKLEYDPLTNDDAAEWYVRAAAASLQDDPQRGVEARALLAKLDAEDDDAARLARDADADASALALTYPDDVQALLGQVEADLRAYNLTQDTAWRSLAFERAAQATFPLRLLPDDVRRVLFPMVDAARNAGPGYSPSERETARVIASHQAAVHDLPVIGRVLSHNLYLQITAPADEYFGKTKMSPLGVKNELVRIGKYLDVGWGGQMTKDTLWVVDSLDDWQHQYPRDYELPRLYKRAYDVLGREDTPEARAARQAVRRTIVVAYPSSTEARSFISS